MHMISWCFGRNTAKGWLLTELLLAALLVVNLGFSAAVAQVETKTFKNRYMSFEMPSTWDCRLEETEFVCQEIGVKQVSSIAILTAKITEPSADNAAVYTSELGLERELRLKDGRTILSKPLENRVRCIGAKNWHWGKQYQSEVPGYFTEYFATVSGSIAILLTVSYHRNFEAEGREIAQTIARHLRVIFKPDDPSVPSQDNRCSVES
jgi:hypothetical protein